MKPMKRAIVNQKLVRTLGAWAMASGFSLASACAPTAAPKNGAPDLATQRQAASVSTNGDEVAAWMFDELLLPTGERENARKARARLDEIKADTMRSHFARGLDDSVHGRLKTAPEHYLRAAQAARESDDPIAPLLAAFALEQAIALRSNTSGLYARFQDWVKLALKEPKNLGPQARNSLVEWELRESYAAEQQGKRSIEQLSAELLGCLSNIRLAGPFGNGSLADQVLPLDSDGKTDWPLAWPADPLDGHIPAVLEVQQEGCLASAKKTPERGVFLAQADVRLDKPTRFLLSMSNALEVRVNGTLVLSRKPTEWGSHAKLLVQVALPAGIHRIEGKLDQPSTVLRLTDSTGVPLGVNTLEQPALSPSVATPEFDAESPNLLRQWVSASSATPPASSLEQYLAAALAYWSGEPEAATLLLEPLVKEPTKSSGVALALAADIVLRDPVFNAEQTQDLARELHTRALARDPLLWHSELNRVSLLAQTKGLETSVAELKQLVEKFPDVPAFLDALGRVYGELGWRAEHRQTVLMRALRFPEDADGLFAAAVAHEEAGEHERADALYTRILELDPDTEVFVGRAIERRDYPAAIAELRRLRERHPHRKELMERVEELLRRTGQTYDPIDLLKQAVQKEPTSGRARLELADALYARGDTKSLERALVEAVQADANTGPLKTALDLVEGMTELERFRLDTHKVIADFEAGGQRLEGTAARVLDYMTTWVRSDGSSRLLEHEIVKIQSAEAITQFAEQNVGEGIILKARVIKRDGSILEPGLVQGKPTITFPHVEIGDYIETERLFGTFTRSAGLAYEGPNWFFREQNVAYARSEFIFIAPRDQKVEFTYRGNAPQPNVHDEGYFRVYHFRVDQSPAAPNEPYSVPINEYLPNVRVTWGLNLQRRLDVLQKRTVETTPVDPRIVRIAQRIVEDVPKDELARAKALYHWVMDNVRTAEDEDGRRAVVGKRGNRWRAFIELCRSIGIPTRWAIARNALFPAPQGEAEVAAQYSENLLLVGSKKQAWVQLGDQFAPFGYVPAPVRGMPAYLLGGDKPTLVTLPAEGEPDHISFEGEVKLSANGSALVEFDQIFAGRYGAGVRQGLTEVGEGRIEDVVESQILAKNLKGAMLREHEVRDLDNLDVPLAIHMEAEVSRFAVQEAGVLVFEPPFTPRLSQFATLPTRQTPLLMRTDQDWRVKLSFELPNGSKVDGVASAELSFEGMAVSVKDRVEKNRLIIERRVRIPAGRISPDDYARFVRFTRDADRALGREIRVQLR